MVKMTLTDGKETFVKEGRMALAFVFQEAEIINEETNRVQGTLYALGESSNEDVLSSAYYGLASLTENYVDQMGDDKDIFIRIARAVKAELSAFIREEVEA